MLPLNDSAGYSLVEGDEGCSGKLLYLGQHQKIMQHMHGNILYMFDCWADPVVHLILLLSSMDSAYL